MSWAAHFVRVDCRCRARRQGIAPMPWGGVAGQASSNIAFSPVVSPSLPDDVVPPSRQRCLHLSRLSAIFRAQGPLGNQRRLPGGEFKRAALAEPFAHRHANAPNIWYGASVGTQLCTVISARSGSGVHGFACTPSWRCSRSGARRSRVSRRPVRPQTPAMRQGTLCSPPRILLVAFLFPCTSHPYSIGHTSSSLYCRLPASPTSLPQSFALRGWLIPPSLCPPAEPLTETQA